MRQLPSFLNGARKKWSILILKELFNADTLNGTAYYTTRNTHRSVSLCITRQPLKQEDVYKEH
jgi:hypothetical protein